MVLGWFWNNPGVVLEEFWGPWSGPGLVWNDPTRPERFWNGFGKVLGIPGVALEKFRSCNGLGMVPKRFWSGPKAFARILDWFGTGFERILGDPGVFLEWFRSAVSLRWLWACLEWFRSDTDVVLQWFWGCFEMVPK